MFVSQGHTPGANGDARVLKFDKDGKFLAQWGGKGNEPGKFQVAHGLAIDPQGNLWVADRENQRIQVFTPAGAFVREMKFNGVPCSIAIGPQGAFMVNGYAAQIVQMDLNGKVLAVHGQVRQGAGRVRRGPRDRRQPEERDLRRRLGERDAAEVREEVGSAGSGLQSAVSEL